MFVFFWDKWDGRSGSTDLKAGQKLRRVIDWESDTDGSTPDAVLGILASLPVPANRVFKGAAHPTYTNAFCVALSCDPSGDDPRMGTVTADYEEPAPTFNDGFLYPGDVPGGSAGGSPNTPQPLPWQRGPTLKGSFRRVDTYPDQDLDGTKFENPAGDRFDNPPPVPRASILATFTTWQEIDAWDASIGRAYMNKANSDVWRGFAARTCAVVGLEFAPKVEAGLWFWELNWQVEIGEQTFFDANNTVPSTAFNVAADRVRIPMYGYNCYGTANTPASKKEIVVNEKPLASPAKLNADGTIRAADLKPLCKDFRVRDLISFAGL